MKYLLILLLSSTMAFGQNTMSFEIANNPYTYAFDKAKKRFSICTKKGIQDICVSKIVTATDPFAVSIELREFTTTALNQFEYNIYGVFLKPDSISNYSYTVPEINLDTATLINDNKAQITLTNALKAHSFTVVKNESVYTITANKNDFPTLPVITKTTTTNIQANAATFKSDIAQQIMSALNSANSDRSKAIEAQQKTAIETHLATFYKRKIAPSKPYNYEDTIKLKTAATPSVEESFYIYSLFENGSFYLRTCDENCTDSVKTYGAFPLSISEKDFVDKMLKQHNQFAQTTDNETVLKALYTKLATKISAQKVVLAEKKETDKLNSLLDSIVNIETRYSGVMTLAPSFGLYKQPNDSLTNEEKRKYRRTVEEERFIVHSATLRFFNNKVDNAAVVGTFEKRPTDTIILYNRQWSLPLRAFANDSQSNKYRDKWNGEELNYYYSDILTYSPEEQYHYAVANTEITLTPGKPVKIKARNVNDYFTGVFFSDFLGLNSNNSNSLIVAEGRVRIPWHFRTIGKHTFFDNLSAYLSVNLFSGFESSSRRINLDDVVVASAADFDETDNRLFITNNFDLLSNNNVDAGLQLALYSVEWKGANTNIHFRYGARFLRTGVQYNLLETTTTTSETGETVTGTKFIEQKSFQVYSAGHEAEIHFEIRPQAILGADLTMGLNWLDETGTNRNGLNFRSSNKSPNIKVMSNFYAFTDSDDSDSGVFVRLGMHYNIGNSRAFPQFLVGYATNLTSFVNKVRKDGK